MKLRNKKTGEIVDNIGWDEDTEEFCVSGNRLYFYNSLTELNEEWEDYDQKYVWYIDWEGDIRFADAKCDWSSEKSIGNYFETKGEAEKAVEKLKTLKRMKDTGFKFNGWKFTPAMGHIGNFITIAAEIPHSAKNQADLDLLFGEE